MALLKGWFHEEEQDLRLEEAEPQRILKSRPKNLFRQKLAGSSYRLPRGKTAWADYNKSA